MDHVEIWEKAKALLREELANVSYTTWIDHTVAKNHSLLINCAHRLNNSSTTI